MSAFDPSRHFLNVRSLAAIADKRTLVKPHSSSRIYECADLVSLTQRNKITAFVRSMGREI
jgi:hypothetical protein